MERLCIYPKDITRGTGRIERYGHNLIQKIKEAIGKRKHQLITLDDFCRYTGLEREQVVPQLR